MENESELKNHPSLFTTELESLSKANHYVTEEELRTEIYNIQNSQYLDELYFIKDNFNILKETSLDNPSLITTLSESILKKYIHNINKKPTLDVPYLSSLRSIPIIEDEINSLLSSGIISNYSKEQFGIMILRIVHRLSKKGNFAGYTEGWKMDFYSNALEKILSYAINNINLEMISPRSGERVKVFAYITQIASNAFIEIINKRKQEQNDLMEHIIPFEDFYDHVKKNYNPVYENIKETKEQPEIKLICIKDDDSLYKFKNENEDLIGYRVVQIEGLNYIDICDLNNINGVLEVLTSFRLKTDKIQFIFPLEYTMSFNEYSEIILLNYKYLNVTKVEKEKYIPSFPKRQKKIREDRFEEWE
jgi:hypothetical protein